MGDCQMKSELLQLSDNDKKIFNEFSDQLTSLGKGAGIASYVIQPVQRPPRYTHYPSRCECWRMQNLKIISNTFS